MKRWFFRLRQSLGKIFVRRIIFELAPALERHQIVRALASEIPGVPVFEAVQQLIDMHERNCVTTAVGMVADHGLVASELGGIQVLQELRQELFSLREEGRRDEEN